MRITYFFYYIFINVVETLIRLFPVPAKTGYRKIGSPNENSPVLLTCNFHLTIHRLKRAIRGIDCHLLIANSKGINVWCAAAGGLLNNHSVISVIKTSGIEEKANHRTIVLPQLAASGIEAKVIQKKTGWKVIWGPIYAKDIPRFLEKNFTKSEAMRQVNFPIIERIEMATMWWFFLAVIQFIFWIPFIIWKPFLLEEALSMCVQIFCISVISFILFPLFEPLLKAKNKADVKFNLKRLIVIFIMILIAATGVVIYTFVIKDYDKWMFIRWSIISFIMVIIINMDLTGTTPVLKSDLHEERLFHVVIDKEKCKGTGICVEVCPRNCLEMDTKTNKVSDPRAKDCVQCGACIVQCPFDALFFRNNQDEIITPENVRKYKLNLMGKRDCCLACKISNTLSK